jgi:hypothetical protein
VLAEEVRLSCTQSMLQCLERGERVAFVLGDIFELSSADAAWILETSPAAYRKRLERARTPDPRVHGIHVRPGEPGSVLPLRPAGTESDRTGRIDPRTPSFTAHPVSPSGRDVAQAADQLATACTTPPPSCGRTRTMPRHRPRSTRSWRCSSPGGFRCWNDLRLPGSWNACRGSWTNSTSSAPSPAARASRTTENGGAVTVHQVDLPDTPVRDAHAAQVIGENWVATSPLRRAANNGSAYLEAHGVSLRAVHLHGHDIAEGITPHFIGLGWRYIDDIHYCLTECDGVQWLEVPHPTLRQPLQGLAITVVDRAALAKLRERI